MQATEVAPRIKLFVTMFQRSRKPLDLHGSRGFKSHPLRQFFFDIIELPNAFVRLEPAPIASDAQNVPGRAGHEAGTGR